MAKFLAKRSPFAIIWCKSEATYLFLCVCPLSCAPLFTAKEEVTASRSTAMTTRWRQTLLRSWWRNATATATQGGGGHNNGAFHVRTTIIMITVIIMIIMTTVRMIITIIISLMTTMACR